MFRPSDDATVFPYLLPSNIFALTVLGNVIEIIQVSKMEFEHKPVRELIKMINRALNEHGKIKNRVNEEIFAYEVNGYGSYNLMDDANVPIVAVFKLSESGLRKRPYLSRRSQVCAHSRQSFFFLR
jgi:meiotically up-regulated gene 157 (Mug157) protein